MFYSYYTGSDIETMDLGRQVGRLLMQGDVVSLSGELGSGKTCFAKGLALGLGVGESTVVTSPTFALLNEYQGRLIFYHMDAYRLEDLDDFIASGLEEYLYGDAVVAIEWADRWPDMLPEYSLKVKLEILDDKSRKVILSCSHKRSLEILEMFSKLRKESKRDQNRSC